MEKQYESQTHIFKHIKGVEIRLDLHKPLKQIFAKAPLLVIIHGGGFTAGIRDWMNGPVHLISDRLFSSGCAIASIDYRLQPDRCIDGLGMQYEDCMDAIRYLAIHADEFGVDRENMGLLGASAGGTMVLMCGFCGPHDFPGDEKLKNAPSFNIRFIVNFFGIPDFTMFESLYHSENTGAGIWWHNELPENIKNDLRKKYSPITYLKKSSPPLLTIHGTVDPIVPYKTGTELHQKADQIGQNNKLITIKGGGHGWTELNKPETKAEFEDMKQQLWFFTKKYFGV